MGFQGLGSADARYIQDCVRRFDTPRAFLSWLTHDSKLERAVSQESPRAAGHLQALKYADTFGDTRGREEEWLLKFVSHHYFRPAAPKAKILLTDSALPDHPTAYDILTYVVQGKVAPESLFPEEIRTDETEWIFQDLCRLKDARDQQKRLLWRDLEAALTGMLPPSPVIAVKPPMPGVANQWDLVPDGSYVLGEPAAGHFDRWAQNHIRFPFSKSANGIVYTEPNEEVALDVKPDGSFSASRVDSAGDPRFPRSRRGVSGQLVFVAPGVVQVRWDVRDTAYSYPDHGGRQTDNPRERQASTEPSRFGFVEIKLAAARVGEPDARFAPKSTEVPDVSTLSPRHDRAQELPGQAWVEHRQQEADEFAFRRQMGAGPNNVWGEGTFRARQR
jgi:hypothetical protein